MLFHDDDRRKVPGAHRLNEAHHVQDMAPPGYRPYPLKGNRVGLWPVSDQEAGRLYSGLKTAWP